VEERSPYFMCEIPRQSSPMSCWWFDARCAAVSGHRGNIEAVTAASQTGSRAVTVFLSQTCSLLTTPFWLLHNFFKISFSIRRFRNEKGKKGEEKTRRTTPWKNETM